MANFKLKVRRERGRPRGPGVRKLQGKSASFLLKDIPTETWERFREHCKQRNWTCADVLTAFIRTFPEVDSTPVTRRAAPAFAPVGAADLGLPGSSLAEKSEVIEMLRELLRQLESGELKLSRR
jgi:hypothetical protein